VLTIRLNGRTVRPDQLRNELERSMLRSIEAEVKDRLRYVLDPVTGERPKVVMEGRSLDRLSFQISGSAAVVEEAKRKLR